MIVVTGATGTVGREVVTRLRALGKHVRAVTREPCSARVPDGIEVVAGDLSNPQSLSPHLHGVRSVFLIWPFVSPDLTTRLAPQLLDVIAAQCEHVVYLSALAATEDPQSFWAVVERVIEQSGIAYTFLRPTGFAKNTLAWASQIRVGDVVRWPYGGATRSLIHERDIADVAVQALTEDGHDGQAYALSGPAALTQIEQVRIISDVLHRSLSWEELSPEVARVELAKAFGDTAFADAALATWARFVDHPEPVTATVKQLTGHPARTFHQWVSDHANAFR